MIRKMKHGEQNKVRALMAKLNYEDQVFWRKQTRSLEECFAESNKMPISEKIKGKSVIFLAEEDGMVVGLCWCTIVDRGVDKQGEIAEFYVEKDFRNKGIGKQLITAAKQLFIDQNVAVAFVWTHRGNDAAKELFKSEGFKEVDQLVMAFVSSEGNNTEKG